MLNIYADYHTHTDMSHGTGTARENIEAAIALGLKRIAISDHSIGHAWYGIRDIDRYVDTVLSLKEEYKGKIDVLLGIELNLVGMKGDLDIPEKYADKFDIKLLGYHKCGKQVDLISAWQLGLRRLTPSLSAKHTKAFEKLWRQVLSIYWHIRVMPFLWTSSSLPISAKDTAFYMRSTTNIRT